MTKFPPIPNINDFFDTFTQEDEMGLLPRRQEIFNVICDHPYISLDSIARRFPTTPRRTISYDVLQLMRSQKIVKHGKTRGVVYSAK